MIVHSNPEEPDRRIASIRTWRSKVILTFDDETSLALPLAVFELLNRKEGDLFNPSAIRAVQKPAVALCFARCCRSLSLRWKTTKEMKEALRESAWPESVIRETVDLLTEASYLDDRRYAEAYFARRSAQGFGIRRIRAELLQKGISKELADEVLEASESDSTSDPGLQKAVRKAMLGKNIEDAHDRQKAVAALIRKGYSYPKAMAAVEEFRGESQE